MESYEEERPLAEKYLELREAYSSQAKEPRPMMTIFETDVETRTIRTIVVTDPDQIQRDLIAKIIFQSAQLKHKDEVIKSLKSKMTGKEVVINRVNFNNQN